MSWELARWAWRVGSLYYKKKRVWDLYVVRGSREKGWVYLSRVCVCDILWWLWWLLSLMMIEGGERERERGLGEGKLVQFFFFFVIQKKEKKKNRQMWYFKLIDWANFKKKRHITKPWGLKVFLHLNNATYTCIIHVYVHIFIWYDMYGYQ